MDTLSLIYERYKKSVRDLFPLGLAWEQVREASSSFFEKLVCILATEVQRIDQRSQDLIKESNPKSTFEMLEDWETFLGIPDHCTPDGEITLSERRVRICQKLTTGGGQNKAFYELIAQQLGYDTDIIDVEDFSDFRVGQSVVGDRLTNGSNASTGWAFTFAIVAPATLIKKFTVGQSTVGERLVLINNETLECVINKFKPAHTNVLFSFGDDI